MTDYVFETITAAEALAYNAATDTLRFINGNAAAFNTLATFNTDGTIVLVASTRTLTFGSGLGGEVNLIFTTLGRAAVGTAGGDLLVSNGGNDRLHGGFGDDTLAAGAGNDILVGGPGADLFIVESFDRIVDWEASDRIAVPGGVAATLENVRYVDFVTTGSVDAMFADGAVRYVILRGQLATTLYVAGSNNRTAATVEFTSLSTGIDFGQIVPQPQLVAQPLAPATPPASPAPAPLAIRFGVPTPTAGSGTITLNVDNAQLTSLFAAPTTEQTANRLVLTGIGQAVSLSGLGFTYNAAGDLLSGTVTDITLTSDAVSTNLTGFSVSAAQLDQAVAGGSPAFFGLLFAGANSLTGGMTSADLLRGYGGNDTLSGLGGANSLMGGEGDDVLYASTRPSDGFTVAEAASLLRGEDGADYAIGTALADNIDGGAGDDTLGGGAGADLIAGREGADQLFGELGNDVLEGGSGRNFFRGGEGDDLILGGDDFDDTHGNVGNDTVRGGGFDDWVVGGQGSDMLFGEDGGDLCYGQVGADTVDGGAGDDAVVGGQANDMLSGGAGNDFLTGDRGDDTVTGGSGADVFHTNAVQGLDQIADFNLAEGDRIQIDPGNTYTLRQTGPSTVIDFGGGNTCVLVNVQMSSLTGGWIFGG